MPSYMEALEAACEVLKSCEVRKVMRVCKRFYLQNCMWRWTGSSEEASRLCMDKAATGAALSHVCAIRSSSFLILGSYSPSGS